MTLILLRRNEHNKIKAKATLKLYPVNSGFSLSYLATEMLRVKSGDGLDFYVDKTNKKVYLEKSSHKLSYKLNKMSACKVLRFSSKDLFQEIAECFGLNGSGVHKFLLEKTGKKFELKYDA